MMQVVRDYLSVLSEASKITQLLCPVIEMMLDVGTLLCFTVFIMHFRGSEFSSYKIELRNYEIELRKMTSHLELLNRKVL